MKERDPRFVVARRPVNGRTTPRPAAQERVPAAAVERLRAARARNQLGAPLAEQLRRPPARGAPLQARALVGAVGAACGGLGLFMAWLHASPLGGVVGAAALVGGVLTARGRRDAPSLAAPDAKPLFDEQAVQAFDNALGRLGPELPPEVVQPLAAFKQLVVRMARQPAAIDEHFLLDDRLYVGECLRRYLPDTLQAYLAVPRELRTTPLAGGETPQALLLAQLALLRGEMEAREAKLARGAAEALLRQQRFLNAKRS